MNCIEKLFETQKRLGVQGGTWFAFGLPQRVTGLFWVLAFCAVCFGEPAHAGTPVSLYRSIAGNLNYVATGGSLRTQPNTGNACAVTNSNTAALSGIPAGASIRAAYLYWAGSGATPDDNITLDGTNLTASRSFTETFILGSTYDFFSGFIDITTQVASKGNGNYTFSNLSVNNGAPHCAVQAVVSGWTMLVVYEDVGEPLRVINVFDGFQYFRGGTLTLTPDNFVIPNSGIDGRHGILTWEGDVENSAPLGGFSEALTLNGTPLTDALNPPANQFNSTINVLGSNTSYGVDLDVYDVSGLLSPGDTSATSVYTSGGDLVLLSMEVISVTNTPVADLAISKTHSGDFTVGQNGSYTLTVSNNGPSDETGTITVTDTLPAGLGYVSASGTGWTCGALGQDVTCTHPGPLAAGNSLPDIALTVSVGAAAVPGVTNSATVSGTQFDNQAANNTSSDPTSVVLSPSITVLKSASSATANPGDVITYTVQVFNTGAASAINVVLEDDISEFSAWGLDSYGAGQAFQFIEGAPPSGLTLGAPVFSNNNGASYVYPPVSGGGGASPGYDANVTNWRLPMTGSMNANSSFTVQYQVEVK